MKITKEQIREIAFQAKETWNDKDIEIFAAGFEKALKMFVDNVKSEVSDCSKCGRSGYSSGKPFCTDDFCNNPIKSKP